ncbi:MAG: hypothetical protein MUP70_11585 [Candidatus Aminicenantes bacterium]|nr:hypothetical protein [Candidatus Aminicenantes bacterium]
MTGFHEEKRHEFSGPGLEAAIQRRMDRWMDIRLPGRIKKKDTTVWFDPPRPETADRLGWLDLPLSSRLLGTDFKTFRGKIRQDGFDTVILLGMGGSSLAPEVFDSLSDVNGNGIPLHVCDTTHPTFISRLAEKTSGNKILFLVSSKSGTTLETMSLFRFFWRRSQEKCGDPGDLFAAVTDEGSPLQSLAEERHFRAVFNAPSDVGGRYSALSAFGLVPAVLSGLDIGTVLGRITNKSGKEDDYHAGLRLGAVLADLADGRDKLTFFTTPGLSLLPDWMEQLIAESTGKDGRGFCPVVSEPSVSLSGYGRDRAFIFLGLKNEWTEEWVNRRNDLAEAGFPVMTCLLNDVLDIGSEMFRWETAVAAGCAAMGIHPFDQPDVQAAKSWAQKAMESGDHSQREMDPPLSVFESEKTGRLLDAFLKERQRGDYIALQAYLAPDPRIRADLQAIRRALLERIGLATTLGFGPRFLHSTGQLHKGGPNTGLFIQLLDEPERDLPVPETDYTFRQIIASQAEGDFRALSQKGRRVIRLQLGMDAGKGLERLIDIVR